MSKNWVEETLWNYMSLAENVSDILPLMERNRREILCEENGVPEVINKYSDYICDNILKTIGEEGFNGKIVIKDKDIDPDYNFFFRRLTFIIQYKIDNNSKNSYCNGGYDCNLSKWNNRKKIFDNIVFNFIIEGNEENYGRVLRYLFPHEFLHSYSDYKLRLNGEDLNYKLSRNGYNKYSNNRFSEEYLKSTICNIFYMLNEFEMEAYLQTFNAEMKENLVNVADKSSAIAIMKNSLMWKRFENVSDDIATILSIGIKDEKQAEDVVSMANFNSRYDFKTFNDFEYTILTLWNRCWGKFYRNACKIVTDIYLKNKEKGLGYKIMDEIII